MMEFPEDLFQLGRPVIHNDDFFSGEKFIDVQTPTLLPALSPYSIESIFNSEENQSPVNQKSNTMESLSLRKERMLENGQIKMFTQAIDSYYNAALGQDPCSYNSASFDTTFIPTDGCNSTLVNDTQVSSLPTQYLISQGNQVSEIAENGVSMKQKNCQKSKIWNSNVGKKILAVYFSPMNIKSEFLSRETVLDGFESFAVQEAAFALQEIIELGRNNAEDLNLFRENLYADPLPVDLVSSCEKSRAIRKLSLHDKIILLKNAFLDLNAMKNVTTYNPAIDGWHFGDKICSRTALYSQNPISYKKAVYFMDTFPARFKSDYNVIALLFLIIIFNPDLPKLKFRNTIKSEQYIYIYLLQKYLISCIESTCEAMDYFYQLMTTIEEIQVLKRATEQDFEIKRSDGSQWLKNQVVRLIELESIKR